MGQSHKADAPIILKLVQKKINVTNKISKVLFGNIKFI